MPRLSEGTRPLSVSRRDCRTIWASMVPKLAGAGASATSGSSPEEPELALVHRLDRFVDGALEIAMLLAVTALFLGALV
jgi:hypothetical protein